MKRPLAAVALLIAALAACSAGTRSPAGAVRAFAEAAAASDREQVFRLLGPRTRARLQTDARRAAELSGRRQVAPGEMLAVGWSTARFELDDAREIARAGGRSTVEVTGKHGERERVECVREAGAWRIELP